MNCRARRKEARRLERATTTTEDDRKLAKLRKRVRRAIGTPRPQMRRRRGRISANARRDYRRRLRRWQGWEKSLWEWSEGLKGKRLDQQLALESERAEMDRRPPSNLARMLQPKPPLDPSRIG